MPLFPNTNTPTNNKSSNSRSQNNFVGSPKYCSYMTTKKKRTITKSNSNCTKRNKGFFFF